LKKNTQTIHASHHTAGTQLVNFNSIVSNNNKQWK